MDIDIQATPDQTHMDQSASMTNPDLAAEDSPEVITIEEVSPGTEDEHRLSDRIKQLWDDHNDAQAAVKKTKEEMKTIRERLSESLHLMKQLLVTPGCTGGRNGRWASFLRTRKIATSTADRLVRAYRKSTDPQANVVSGGVSEPGEVDVQRLFTSLLPRLRKGLTTSRAAHEFVFLIVGAFDLPCETQANGILVLSPKVNSQEESFSAAAAPLPEAVGGSGEAVAEEVLFSGAGS